jgi:hypothetical protein
MIAIEHCSVGIKPVLESIPAAYRSAHEYLDELNKTSTVLNKPNCVSDLPRRF